MVAGFRLGRFSHLVRRRFGSLINPSTDDSDFGFAQLVALGRHLRSTLGSSDRMDQKAFGGIARDQCRSAVAAFEQTTTGVDAQTHLLLFRSADSQRSVWSAGA